MYRQYKCRIKRKWDKIRCFVECSRKVNLNFLTYGIYTYGFKCNSDLFVLFEINRFMRWIVHVFAVFDGFLCKRALYSVYLDSASDDWIAMLNDDELIEEELENYAYKKMR